MRGRFWNRGERVGSVQPVTATMDWMEASVPRGLQIKLDKLTALNNQSLGQSAGNLGQSFVGYVGTPNVTTTSGSITTPKVTYNTSAISKSYSNVALPKLK